MNPKRTNTIFAKGLLENEVLFEFSWDLLVIATKVKKENKQHKIIALDNVNMVLDLYCHIWHLVKQI